MIVIRLEGGLGNQMFQYAFGRALSLQKGQELVLDTSSFKRMKWTYLAYRLARKNVALVYRNYHLDLFDIQARVLTSKEQKALKVYKKKGKFYSSKIPITQQSNAYQFEPAALDVSSDHYLVGYWQNLKYFEEIREILLKEFRPKLPLDALNQARAERIASTESIGVHIRLGDYRKHLNSLLSAKFYLDAIEEAAKKVENPTIFFFSDEPQWVAENLKIPYNSEIISGNAFDDVYKDMHLMALCKKLITSRSTFSWWAAWLNENKESEIYYANPWSQQEDFEKACLIPDSLNWIGLD